MMDHKTLIAQMDPDLRAALTDRSDWPGIKQLAGHLGAIGVSSALIIWAVPGWPLVMLVQGVLLVFLFTPLHETTHDTPFRTLWMSRALGWLCGAVLMIPPIWFRYFHLAHHRWTQIPGKDPELAAGLPATRAAYMWAVTGIPLWRSVITTLLRNARGGCSDDFVPQGRRDAVAREARGLCALYLGLGATLIVSPLVLWLWVVPMVIGQPFLRLYLMAEHGRCAFVANMLENSRTTLTNRVMRWLAWNMPYHAEHHSYPAVPFHRLPDLHTHMAPFLVQTAPGYTAFHRRLTKDLADA